MTGWVQANKISPLRRWWDPELVFTGVSIMRLNPESGWSSVCARSMACNSVAARCTCRYAW
jgi:hypothetical protein